MQGLYKVRLKWDGIELTANKGRPAVIASGRPLFSSAYNVGEHLQMLSDGPCAKSSEK